jgi:hypothetical protein
VTAQIDLDLSDAYNRIADTWYPIFASSSQSSMPVAACAYPINMGELSIASIRDEVQPEDYHLRWQMAVGGSEYHLYCNWQGRAWQQDGARYLFIDNAVGWVDWQGGQNTGQLQVHISFGRPYFENNVGTMVVDFYVSESDGNGTVSREVHRPFQIHADGRRQQQF